MWTVDYRQGKTQLEGPWFMAILELDTKIIKIAVQGCHDHSGPEPVTHVKAQYAWWALDAMGNGWYNIIHTQSTGNKLVMDVKTENTDDSNVNDSPEVLVNISFETI